MNERRTRSEGGAFRPLLDRDFPDPDILRAGEAYYAYSTNSGRAHIQVARSYDLAGWEYLGDALPELPGWAVHHFGYTWAPEVVESATGGYVMYFTTRRRTNGRQCVALAESDNPAGPFRPLDTGPLVDEPYVGGAIDPATFTNEDGTRYLLWKNDGNRVHRPTWIFIQQLVENGLALADHSCALIKADRSWEGEVIEAPTLCRHGERFWLFYSANEFQSAQYAIGCAWAHRPEGLYHKAEGPLLAGWPGTGLMGPGGQDLIVDADGQTWMFFHASVKGRRCLHRARLEWQGEEPCLEWPGD